MKTGSPRKPTAAEGGFFRDEPALSAPFGAGGVGAASAPMSTADVCLRPIRLSDAMASAVEDPLHFPAPPLGLEAKPKPLDAEDHHTSGAIQLSGGSGAISDAGAETPAWKKVKVMDGSVTASPGGELEVAMTLIRQMNERETFPAKKTQGENAALDMAVQPAALKV
uniref:Uncharacterized protein n=1 Tax=Rhizochromulina marina TaxID=1034831 RepID=A0A7S2WU20_9STRA|mmetsp:Transcript_5546/g.16377  ORF Transcript_5546/g.16377 Transcript_5546/m.16377 type:complete len:167 (+) Transcript_5546:2-502(+)